MTQSLFTRRAAAFFLVWARLALVAPAALAQTAEPPKEKQSIRLEAAPDGRMRLKLEGPETWTVEAQAFEVRGDPDGVRLVAQPLNVQIQTAHDKSIANEFELLIKPDGLLGFKIRNSRRIK